MERWAHRLPTYAPIITDRNRDAVPEQKLRHLRNNALIVDVAFRVVSGAQHKLGDLGVRDHEEAANGARWQQIHWPRLHHPLVQRLEERPAQQVLNVLRLCVSHGNVRLASPQSTQLRQPTRRRERPPRALDVHRRRRLYLCVQIVLLLRRWHRPGARSWVDRSMSSWTGERGRPNARRETVRGCETARPPLRGCALAHRRRCGGEPRHRRHRCAACNHRPETVVRNQPTL
mmetsp:Transcript_10589/g.19196  ORF Transcript_10589/g.19196 Transcript_10589/m.19196 type:complete len:231 (-) Transcript_10589:95-787(-)